MKIFSKLSKRFLSLAISIMLILSVQHIPASIVKAGGGSPVEVTDFSLSVTTVENWQTFALRVEYAGGPDGIHAGDYISIKIDNSVSDIIKISGFGNSTADIYGNDPIGKVGTRTYRNDSDGNYYLDVVFDDGYSNYYSDRGNLGEIGNIAGWYEASAYIEYKKEISENIDHYIEVYINGEKFTIGVDVSQGGGSGAGSDINTPGTIADKNGNYGRSFGSIDDIPESPDNDYSKFDSMRWNLNIGFQNLTCRDLRATGGTSYFTTGDSLAYSNNNPEGAKYQSENEPYLKPYSSIPWIGKIDSPYLYNNAVINDYMVVGDYYGTVCNGHEYIEDSIRIIRIFGREKNSQWEYALFKPLADSNFLMAAPGEPINRSAPYLYWENNRGLTIEEFLTQMHSEGQLLDKNTVDDILTVDYVRNSDAPYSNTLGNPDALIAHFTLELGDMHFGDTNATVNLINTDNDKKFSNVPAKNLPYAYMIYYDTQATEAQISTSNNISSINYFDVFSFSYDGGKKNSISNDVWIKLEDKSGGGGIPTELKIKKIDENNDLVKDVKFILTQTNTEPKKSRAAVTTINGTASFTLGVGEYILTEEVPEERGLNPIAPITFKVTDVTKPVNLTNLLSSDYSNPDDITFANGVNTIVNHTSPPLLIVLKTLAEIEVTKNISGISETTETTETFDFTLRELNSNTADDFKDGGISQSKTVEGAGTVKFQINDLTAGIYYYQVNETPGNADNWIYDTMARIVKVVIDDGLNVSTELNGNPLTFTNIYNPIDDITPEPTTPESTTPEPTTQKPTISKPTTPEPTTQKPTTQKPAATTEIPMPELSTEPVINEPTELAATTSEPSAQPTIDETTELVVSMAEPHSELTINETAGPELQTNEEERRIPLNNGWFAEYNEEEDLWYIYDENGVPLGKIKLPAGEDITGYDVEQYFTPLGNTLSKTEMPQSNPQTGDTGFPVYLFLFLGICLPVIGATLKFKRNGQPERSEEKIV